MTEPKWTRETSEAAQERDIITKMIKPIPFL
jgi:hypothetical protein